MKQLKKIPKFKSEKDERQFWLSHDSTQYIDWIKAQKGSFPNLKPTTRLISIRLPEHLLEKIKARAHKMDIPYQSLIKKHLSQI